MLALLRSFAFTGTVLGIIITTRDSSIAGIFITFINAYNFFGTFESK